VSEALKYRSESITSISSTVMTSSMFMNHPQFVFQTNDLSLGISRNGTSCLKSAAQQFDRIGLGRPVDCLPLHCRKTPAARTSRLMHQRPCHSRSHLRQSESCRRFR
jgi:hypothetical protein